MSILGKPGSRWRGPVAVSAVVAVAAALAGYAAAGAGHPASGPAAGGVVTLGDNGQAWRLTDSVVSVRGQGTWVPVSTPVRPAAGNSVARRGSLVLVAGLSGNRLTLATSRDGGRSWATRGADSRSRRTARSYPWRLTAGTGWSACRASRARAASASSPRRSRAVPAARSPR